MKILTVTDHTALNILIQRVLKKSIDGKIGLETCDTVGSTLRSIKNKVPDVILLDGDSPLARDQVLFLELCRSQESGAKVVFLKSSDGSMGYPDFPSNDVLNKSQITILPKIIIRLLGEGGKSNDLV